MILVTPAIGGRGEKSWWPAVSRGSVANMMHMHHTRATETGQPSGLRPGARYATVPHYLFGETRKDVEEREQKQPTAARNSVETDLDQLSR
jgi:hypothetical protein